MRFPVYSKQANPAVDPPLIRKSRSYVLDLIAIGEVCWIDPRREELGVIGTRRYTRHSGEPDRRNRKEFGNMDDAWIQLQSGYAGPMVLQMPPLEIPKRDAPASV